MKKLILIVFGMLLSLPSMANEFNYAYKGQILTYTVIDEIAKTCKTSKNSISGKLVIPSVAKDGDKEYTVISIGDYGFSYCQYLTSVEIPNTVTSIGSYAFNHCTTLSSAVIGDGVLSIGEHAFSGCHSLTSIAFSNSLTTIGDLAFYDCKELSGEIIIPRSVVSIGNRAFCGCCKLTSVLIGDSVTSIGENIFETCTMLKRVIYPNAIKAPIEYKTGEEYICASYPIEGVIFEDGLLFGPGKTNLYYVSESIKGDFRVPESVKIIERLAFGYCNITSVTIPNTVNTINFRAFKNCYYISQLIIEDAEEALTIESDAFTNCQIKTLFLGRDLLYTTNLYQEDAPFYKMTSLEDVSLGNFVTRIGRGLFYGCTNLTSLSISSNLTSIETKAFLECSNLNCDLRFPDSLTIIMDYAFGDCSSLSSLELGNSIEYIGRSAFNGCENLKCDLSIPSSVKEIGLWAFAGCRSLTSVTISDGISAIPDYMFYRCSGMTSVIIPNSVITIGHDAFLQCSNLKTVEMGDSVEVIGAYAFFECKNLTSVTLPNSVSIIGGYAFKDCSSLTSITIPKFVTSIGGSAFLGCCIDATSLVIPSTVKAIGDYALYGLKSLKEVVFEDDRENLQFGDEVFDLNSIPLKSLYLGRNLAVESSVKTPPFKGFETLENLEIGKYVKFIEKEAFSGCIGLRSLIISNAVEDIGLRAFSGCSHLSTVLIGNSVKNNLIINNVFEGCGYLEKAAHPNTIKNPFGQTGDNIISYNPKGSILEDGFIYGPEKLAIYYAPPTLEGRFEIPNSVLSINDGAFYNCKKLTSIVIPNSVDFIGDNAFYYCDKLTSVEIPNSVTTIGEKAFSYCDGLSSIVIPNSVSSIGSYAFDHCLGLKKSAYPNTLEDPFNRGMRFSYPAEGAIIENGFVFGPERSAIYYAPMTISGNYIIPESVKLIGDNTFALCDSLTAVTIPNSITVIGDHAFYECKALTSAEIPSSVTEIDSYAFSECVNLTSVDLSNSVTKINEHVFSGCKKLASVEIPSSIVSIGDNAFYNCQGLKLVVIPNSVTSISNNAFRGCNNIEKSAYPNSLENPFTNCDYICPYPAEGAILEDGFVYGAEKKGIYFAPLTLNGKYEIPNTVKIIGNNTFAKCDSLTNVTIPNSVTEICDGAFSDCSSLTSVKIPSSVSSISKDAFYYCNNLSSIEIPNSVTSIGECAFYHCGHLASIDIPNSVSLIGRSAFFQCGLTSIELPNSVISIEPYAFSYCNKLNGYIYIPNSVTSIGEYAFRGYTNITAFIIGNSVKNIGAWAFSSFAGYNENLSKIFSLNPLPPTAQEDIVIKYSGITLYVPKGSAEKYKSADYWSKFSKIIEFDSNVELSLNAQSLQLNIGESSGLTIKSNSANGLLLIDPETENWISDNETVAIVENGTVKAVGAGTATISYSAKDITGTTHNLSCKVDVTYLRGDANGNGSLAVNDVVLTARGVVKDFDPTLIFDAVDINGDKILTVGDLSQVVNMVISYTPSKKSLGSKSLKTEEEVDVDASVILTNNGSDINIAFDNDGRFTGIQFDIMTDDSHKITSVTLDSKAGQNHSVASHKLENGLLRILAYGTDPFDANEIFATIHTECVDSWPGMLTLTNIMASDFNGNLYSLHDCYINLNSQTGLNDVTNDVITIDVDGRTLIITSNVATKVLISDMKGITRHLDVNVGVTRFVLPTNGIYLVNNKKIVIR